MADDAQDPVEAEAVRLQIHPDDETQSTGELDRPDDEEKADIEAFWAGRNSAMRRSARAAA